MHPAQVVDRFAKHRELSRRNAMRRVHQSLSLADKEFVVDPVVRRIKSIGKRVIGRDHDVIRTRHAVKILLTPRVILYDGHDRIPSKSSTETLTLSPAQFFLTSAITDTVFLINGNPPQDFYKKIPVLSRYKNCSFGCIVYP